MEKLHVPIMVNEIIELLKVTSEGLYVDGTFGEGGHSESLLKAKAGAVIAFDRDLQTLKRYEAQGEYRQNPRLTLKHGLMSQMASQLNVLPLIDGAIVDLGVSTRQLLEPERGFSFNREGPLDMRMDPSSGLSLLEKLSTMNETTLATELQRNADLPGAKKIARRVLDALQDQKLQTTADLAALMGPKRGPRHPATALFLALRMLVNSELDELEAGLTILIQRLKPGARLAVLSFHSTEDRAVKNLFKRLSGRCICDGPLCHCQPQRLVLNLTKKPLCPSPREEYDNPRSRSAKLRCVEKIDVED